MDIEFLRDYCLKKSGVTEDTPFDFDTLVFKVGGKMFALFSIKEFKSINLKCVPETAIDLRESYSAVAPGYHMSKKHWNTITFNEDMEDQEVLKWVDHSYDLVYSKLPKKIKESLDVSKGN